MASSLLEEFPSIGGEVRSDIVLNVGGTGASPSLLSVFKSAGISAKILKGSEIEILERHVLLLQGSCYGPGDIDVLKALGLRVDIRGPRCFGVILKCKVFQAVTGTKGVNPSRYDGSEGAVEILACKAAEGIVIFEFLWRDSLGRVFEGSC
jgi:hypothetical protein